MTALIIAGICAAAWLLTARWLYGRWRGRQVGRRCCGRHGSSENRRYLRAGECCYDAARSSDGEAAACAMAAALVFPLVWLTALIRFRPPPTAAERAAKEAEDAAKLAALQARNAELERELGIGAP
jgi:hypothetical protein